MQPPEPRRGVDLLTALIVDVIADVIVRAGAMAYGLIAAAITRRKRKHPGRHRRGAGTSGAEHGTAVASGRYAACP
jgi:hypothetical protein